MPAGYVGAVPFDFSVNTNGSAVFRVPIEVPPGTAGTEPALSVVHTSGTDNDLLGVGTSLLGLSAIGRVGATRAQDGFTGVVGYGPDDRWSLDGQRLVEVGGSGYDSADAVFHTELQSWTRVVPAYSGTTAGRQGPDSFTASTPDGKVFEYGTTADSALAPGPGCPHVRLWALARVVDRWGNATSYTYTQDPANGCLYPARIDYTRSGTRPARRAVTFDYEDRPAGPDTAARFEAGFASAMVQRLKTITTWLDGAAVLIYTFTYETSVATGRSRLTSITKADAEGIGLPPTVLTWQEGGPAALAASRPLAPTGVSWSDQDQFVPLDANGDGIIDIVHAYPAVRDGMVYLGLDLILARSDGSGFDPPTAVAPTQLPWPGHLLAMDVDGDGCCDLVYACPAVGGESCSLTVFRPGPIEGGTGWTLTPTGPVGGAGPAGLDWPAQLIALDVDGDGRVDLVHAAGVYDHTDQSVRLALQVLWSNGKAFTAASGGPQQTPLRYSATTQVLGLDVNGDGLGDVLVIDADTGGMLTSSLFLSDGTALLQQPDDPLPAGDRPYYGAGTAVMVLDVNGDGRSDLLHAGTARDGSLVLTTYLSTGLGFTAAALLSTTIVVDQGVPPIVVPLDVTGDGMSDLAVAVPGETDLAVTVLSSTGAGFAVASAQTVAFPIGSSVVPLDLSGSGKTGLVTLTPTWSGGATMLSLSDSPAAGPAPDLLVGIDNGIGGTWSVAYRPMTDPTVYTRDDPTAGDLDACSQFSSRGSGATFALSGSGPATATPSNAPATRTVDFPRQLVANHSYSDGRGGSYEYTHAYATAKLDLSGRGWLGFADQSVTDQDRGATTESISYTDFPLTHAPKQVTVSRATDGSVLSITTYTFTTPSTSPGVWLVLDDSRATGHYTDALLDYTRSEVWTAYDAYGNATVRTESVDCVDGAPLTTLTDYTNDPATWRLGQVTRRRLAADVAGTALLSDDQYHYDPDTGALIGHDRWDDQHQRWLVWQFRYDGVGNRAHVIDPSGADTETEYDPTYQTFPYRTISPPNAAGRALTWTYEHDARFGVQTLSLDPNGVTETTGYDDLGRATSLTTPGPDGTPVTIATWRWAQDPQGVFHEESRLVDWVGDSWLWTRNYLDGLGRAVLTSGLAPDGSPVTTIRTFTGADRIRTQSQPYLAGATPVVTAWTYDALGRVTAMVRDPAADDQPAQVTTLTYPSTQTVLRVEAAGTTMARRTTVTNGVYQGRQHAVRITDAAGGTTTLDYDPLGRVTRVADPAATQTLGYDMLGRRLDLTVAGGTAQTNERIVHDDVARAVTQTDALGTETVLTQDALGRVVRKDVTGMGATLTTLITYDDPSRPGAQGRVSSATCPDGTIQLYGYDAQGNQALRSLIVEGATITVRRTWTPGRLVSSFVAPDGTVVSSRYTPAGALGSVTAQSPQGLSAAITYDSWSEVGAPTSVSYGNGVVESLGYDNWHRPTTHDIVDSTGAVVLSTVLHWNLLDQVTDLSDDLDASKSQAFVYDAIGRLSAATGPYPGQTFGYDGAGGLTTTGELTWATDGYQLTTASGAGITGAATYDSAGSLTHLTMGADSAGFLYDAERRLTTYSGTSFGYDHAGRRLRKASPDGTVTTYVDPCFELVAWPDGQVQTTTYLNGLGGPLASITTTENPGGHPATPGIPAVGVQYLHRDHLGSTVAETAGDGTLSTAIDYLPYGAIGGQVGTGAFRSRFTGHEFDLETGLYFMQARYYQPVLGRFLTTDDRQPALMNRTDALHRYAYALGDPLTHIDPTGHFSLSSVWSHTEHWLAKDWQRAASMVTDYALSVAGAIVLATTPLGGPLSTVVGSTLLGAGISGFSYDIKQLVTHKTFSWKDWSIQLGIGGAAGLISGSVAAWGSVAIDAATLAGRTAFYVGGVGRVLANTALATLGSTSGGITSTYLGNLSAHLRWDKGFGWAALIGAGTGFAGGLIGEFVATRLLYTNTPSDEKATDLYVGMMRGHGVADSYDLPSPAEYRAGVTWGSRSDTLIVAVPGAVFSGVDTFFSLINLKPGGRRA